MRELNIALSVQIQFLDRFIYRRDLRDGSAEIMFQSFLWKAIVSSSGVDTDVHALMLSIQHLLCRPELPILQGVLKDSFGEAASSTFK